jgi:tRNA dimethylallyltransferase
MYDFLLIFLNDEREVLYERINNRVDEMINNGLLEEVKSLYPDKLSNQAVKAIGYQEIYDYLDNKISLEEAINLIKQHSRNYAKRQMTWYRNRENVQEVFININNLEETKNKLINIVNEFVK